MSDFTWELDVPFEARRVIVDITTREIMLVDDALYNTITYGKASEQQIEELKTLLFDSRKGKSKEGRT